MSVIPLVGDFGLYQDPKTARSTSNFEAYLIENETHAVETPPPPYENIGLYEVFRQELKSLTVYADITQAPLVTRAIQADGEAARSFATENSTNVTRDNKTKLHLEVTTGPLMRTLNITQWSENPLSDQRAEIPDAAAGNCEWFYATPEYINWKRGSEATENVLVVLGATGTGKSVLAKSVLKLLREEKSTAFGFFCKSNMVQHNTSTNILATLIHRLLEHRPFLKDSASAFLKGDGRSVGFAKLWSMFYTLVSDSRVQDCLFILDGLDECKDSSESDLFQALLDEETPFPGRLLITARPDRVPFSLSKRFRSIEILPHMVSADIKRFLTHKLREKGVFKGDIFGDDLLNEISQHVERNADGLFVYIVLKVEELVEQIRYGRLDLTSNNIREFFTKTPKRMRQHYRALLEQTLKGPETQVDESVALFNILLAAQRPLEKEMLAAVYAFSSQDISSLHEYQKLKRLDIFDFAKMRCGPLVDRKKFGVGEAEILMFTHPTAHEFLERSSELAKLNGPKATRKEVPALSRIGVKQGHILLAKACISYLCMTELWDINDETFDEYPLLRYAIHHWDLHVKECGTTLLPISNQLEKFFTPGSVQFREWCASSGFIETTSIAPEERCQPPPPLITCVRRGISNLIEAISPGTENSSPKLFGLDVDIDARSDEDTTALYVALQVDDPQAAHKLIDLGASPSAIAPSGQSVLHLAVLSDHSNLVRKLLLRGASPDLEAESPFCASPLFYSIATSSITIFNLLLNHGAVRYARSDNGWTILHDAARHNRLDILQVISDRKLIDEINVKSRDSCTPLHIAAGSTGSVQAIEFLLSHAADINATDLDGRTPLFEAAMIGSVENVRCLLEHGANVDASENGFTPLAAASKKGHSECVEHLRRHGAKLNIVSNRVDTPLSLAVESGYISLGYYLLEPLGKRKSSRASTRPYVKQGSLPDVKELSGISESSMDTAGTKFAELPDHFGAHPDTRAFQHACRRGDELLVSKMLQKGADPCELIDSISSLHLAALGGHIPTVEILLEDPRVVATINNVDSLSGFTALHFALSRGHEKLASLLLRKSADPNIHVKTGSTVLTMVAALNKGTMLFMQVLTVADESIISHPGETGDTALHEAAKGGRVEFVQALLDRGADTLAINDDLQTPLHCAALSGKPKVIQALLEYPSLLDFQDIRGWTAFHSCCVSCTHEETILQLHDKTRWYSLIGSRSVPLSIAIIYDNKDAFNVLLKAGVSVNLANDQGVTALHVAAYLVSTYYVTKLIEFGADVTRMDVKNYLALSHAYRFSDDVPSGLVTDLSNLRKDTWRLRGHVATAACRAPALVARLIEAGSDADDADIMNETALMQAVFWDRPDTVELLLTQSSVKKKLNIRSFLSNRTAAMYAAYVCSTECLQLLLDAGTVDLQQKDALGLSLHDYAARHGPSLQVLKKADLAAYKAWKERPKSELRRHVVNNTCELLAWMCRKLPQSAFTKDAHEHDITISKEQYVESAAPASEQSTILENFRRKGFWLLGDAFVLLQDDENACMALEILFGAPYGSDKAFVTCSHCRKSRRSTTLLCKTCPGRTLCKDCVEETKKRNVRGCHLHEFSEIPRSLWFSKQNSPSEESFSEQAWLKGLLLQYEAQRDLDQGDWQPTPFFVDYDPSRPFVLDLVKNKNFTKLMQHIKDFPRDIFLTDGAGNTLCHDCIDKSTSDEDATSRLVFLAAAGAQVLSRNYAGMSTVDLACRKHYRQTTCFLLENFNPDFDTFEDDSLSSQTMKLMIERNWNDALLLAIERHFEWAANGDFSWLYDLHLIGGNPETIVEAVLLDQKDDESEDRVPERSVPWNDINRPNTQNIPSSTAHWKGCVHNKVYESTSSTNQIGTEDDQKLHSINEGAKFEYSDAGYESDEPDSPSVADLASMMCGIAGAINDQSFTVEVEPLARAETRHKGIEMKVKYGVVGQDTYGSILKAIDIAGNGLLQAISLAQSANLCCDSFTIIHSTAIGPFSMNRIEVSLILDLVNACKLLDQESASSSSWNRMCKASGGILKLLGFHELVSQDEAESDEETEPDRPTSRQLVEHSLNICCMAFQVLCLGFFSFLNGHSATLRSPLLNQHIGHFRLQAPYGQMEIIVQPQELTCLGDMLQGKVIVFTDGTSANLGTGSTKAHLKSTVASILEIWGPGTLKKSRIEQDEIDIVEMHGGYLTVSGHSDPMAPNRSAHWSRKLQRPSITEETDRFVTVRPNPTFSLQETLVIGMLRNKNSCRFNHAEAFEAADAGVGNIVSLETQADFWMLHARSVAMNLGYSGSGVSFTQGYDRYQGHYVKGTVLKNWRKRKIGVINAPWGVRFSICTGIAERCTVREAIAEVFEPYLADVALQMPPDKKLPSDWNVTRAVLLRMLRGREDRSRHQNNQACLEWLMLRLNGRDAAVSTFIHVSIELILEHLEWSGIDENGHSLKIAWPHEEDSLAALKLNCDEQIARWYSILRDSTEIATFAVATRACLAPRRGPFSHRSTCREPVCHSVNRHHHHHQSHNRRHTSRHIPIQILETAVIPCEPPTDFRNWTLSDTMQYQIRPDGRTSLMLLLEPLGEDDYLLIFSSPARVIAHVWRRGFWARDYEEVRENHRTGISELPKRVLVLTAQLWNRQIRGPRR